MTTNVYYRQGLTGGGTTDLDAVDGDLLNDGDAAIVYDGGTFRAYLLDDDSGASESSPNIIAPDTNPGNKRWIQQTAAPEFSLLSTKTSNYTMSGRSDIVPVDISSGSVDVSEKALGSMNANAVVEVVCDADAGAGSANKVQIKNSAGTVIAILFRKGQKWRAAYDGTNRRVLGNTAKARVVVAKTADQSLGTNTEATLLDANVAELENDGDIFSSGIVTAPSGDAKWLLYIYKQFWTEGSHTTVYGEHSADGYYVDVPGEGGNQPQERGEVATEVHEMSGGETVTMKAYNGHDSISYAVLGDANNDETKITFELIPDMR